MLSQAAPGGTRGTLMLNDEVQKRRCAKQKLASLKPKVNYPFNCVLAFRFPRHLNPTKLPAITHMTF